MFGYFFDCILTSHGYRVKVYPTYCKCYVFTPVLCSFSEVVRLRYLILEIEGTDEARSTMRTRVSLFEERYRGRTLIARAWRSIACLSSSVFTISIPRTRHHIIAPKSLPKSHITQTHFPRKRSKPSLTQDRSSQAAQFQSHTSSKVPQPGHSCRIPTNHLDRSLRRMRCGVSNSLLVSIQQ
jgi:hypothetical protein